MKKWKIETIEFEPEAAKELKDFVSKNPTYKKLVETRINDLINFPDLVWQSAFIEGESEGYFLTKKPAD